MTDEQVKQLREQRFNERLIKLNADAYKYRRRHTPARKKLKQDSFEISFSGLRGR